MKHEDKRAQRSTERDEQRPFSYDQRKSESEDILSRSELPKKQQQTKKQDPKATGTVIHD